MIFIATPPHKSPIQRRRSSWLGRRKQSLLYIGDWGDAAATHEEAAQRPHPDARGN
jgi:hypothetical protein